MTFFEILHSQFSTPQYLELLLRVVVAAICGGAVGIERSRRFKDAGVRTHCVVACTAAVLMIISKYGFADVTTGPTGLAFTGGKGIDAARIAAQIVSGISFLGVGVIYRDRHMSTKGLTTAAGIWGVAGIGMAIGAGMYGIGLFASAFIVLLQWFMHRFAIGNDKYSGGEMEIVLDDDPQAIQRLQDHLNEWKVVVIESSITREEGEVDYELQVRIPSADLQDDIALYISSDPAVHTFRYSDTK